MGYAFKASVTVAAPTGSHTDFTVVIKGVDTKLKPVGSGGQIVNQTTQFSGGPTVPADLIVSSDAAGTSLYNWGIESWDTSSGTIYIWVRIPTYSAGLTVYVNIGNAAITTYQGGLKAAGFDSSTLSVYHLPPGSGSLSAVDFAGTMNGTITGATAATGVIDGCGAFNGSQYIDDGIRTALNLATAFTFSAWVKQTTAAISARIFGDWGGAENRYIVSTDDTVTNSIIVGVGNGVSLQIDHTTAAALVPGTFVHIAWTWAGSGVNIIYVNGASVALTNNVNALPAAMGTITAHEFIAAITAAGSFVGSIDEVVVSNTRRSANWIATMYANQNSIPLMGAFAANGGLFRVSSLVGIGSGGAFFQNPLN